MHTEVGSTSTVLVDGSAVAVLDCACEPIPPIGDAVLVRLRKAAGFCNPDLRREVTLRFSVGGVFYSGRFRMTQCTMGPNGNECSYASVGPVQLEPSAHEAWSRAAR